MARRSKCGFRGDNPDIRGERRFKPFPGYVRQSHESFAGEDHVPNCEQSIGRLSLTCLLTLFVMPLTAEEYAADIHDHMTHFTEFAAAIETSVNTTDRRDAYRRYFINSDPEVHKAFVDAESLSDGHFDQISSLILEHRDAIRDYHRFIHSQVMESTDDAARRFGDIVYQVPQHLTLNLGRSNAQVRLLGGEVTILYGIDTNAVLERQLFPSTPRDLRATIVHELFHAHHWRTNPFMTKWARRFLPPESDAPLWINVWSEGLANCAGRHVYPDSDIAHVMAIEAIWEEAEPQLAELSAKLFEVLDARDAATTEKWLYVHAGERSDGMPNKAGYILGTVVAHQIVGELGLDAAVMLEGDRLRQAIRGSLADIAAGKVDVDGTTICRPVSSAI